jgi:hypothetical protein
MTCCRKIWLSQVQVPVMKATDAGLRLRLLTMSIPFWDERTFPVNEQRWLGCGVVFCGRYRGSLASAGGCGEVSQGIGMSVASHSCFVAA